MKKIINNTDKTERIKFINTAIIVLLQKDMKTDTQ